MLTKLSSDWVYINFNSISRVPFESGQSISERKCPVKAATRSTHCGDPRSYGVVWLKNVVTSLCLSDTRLITLAILYGRPCSKTSRRIGSPLHYIRPMASKTRQHLNASFSNRAFRDDPYLMVGTRNVTGR